MALCSEYMYLVTNTEVKGLKPKMQSVLALRDTGACQSYGVQVNVVGSKINPDQGHMALGLSYLTLGSGPIYGQLNKSGRVYCCQDMPYSR